MRKKVFIIHLRRAKERLQQVDKITKFFPAGECSVISAVDARDLTDASLKRHYSPGYLRPHYPFALNNGEIACFLSHRACWQRIVNENLDAGLIVEDDLEIDVNTFSGAYGLALNHFRNDLYVRFPVKRRETSKYEIASNGQSKLFVPEIVGLKTTAQLVGVEAARRLLAATESFDRPVDSFLQMSWVHGVNIYCVSPAGVSENDFKLGGSSIQRKLSLSSKFKREVQRFLYRLKIKQFSRKEK